MIQPSADARARGILRVIGGLRAAIVIATVVCLRPDVADAQGLPPPSQSANPICQRLEAQLASIDRGQNGDPRADQINRLEETATRQQGELDRVVQQARRLGCESSGLFAIFGGQSAQCGPINTQIQKTRAALDQTMTALDRLRGPGGSDREGQRRSVLLALAQNNCGPQYAAAARASPGGGIFNDLFGGLTPDGPAASTFRTVCVRSCDGFFFPISFATVPSRFSDDERACKRLCPNADVALYTYRNPGEDMNHAVSTGGQAYLQHPNAFRYRQEYNAACSCRAPGQSWAEALKNSDDRSTMEKGDIVVTEERAKQMSQPRDAQGRPLAPSAPKPANGKAQALTSPPPGAEPDKPSTTTSSPETPSSTTAPTDPASNKPIRSVGPTFIPAR